MAADLWEADYLDLVGQAALTVGAGGQGEIVFGAMQASLDIDYGPDEIGFTLVEFDEMDEVSGDGSAELKADGSLTISFAYYHGAEVVQKVACVREQAKQPVRGCSISRPTPRTSTRVWMAPAGQGCRSVWVNWSAAAMYTASDLQRDRCAP